MLFGKRTEFVRKARLWQMSYRVVGSTVSGRGRPGESEGGGGANKGSVEIELIDASERTIQE